MEQILTSVREAAAAGSLPEHVQQVVANYVPTTSAPFAAAVLRALEFTSWRA